MQHPIWPTLFLSATSFSSSCISEHVHAIVCLLPHSHWTAETVTISSYSRRNHICMKLQLKEGPTEPWLPQQWNQLSLSLTHPCMCMLKTPSCWLARNTWKKNAFGIRTNISLKIELDLLLIWRYLQNLVDWDSLYIMNVGT